jgi:hypothetical protein
MPPVELPGNAGDNANAQPSTITPVPAAFVPPSVKAKIGIIYPPPEVRSNFCTLRLSITNLFRSLLLSLLDIVDKTAIFVARNGPSFESKVKEAEANNSKFNFLNPHDPYNAYYLHKVREFAEGKGPAPGAAEQQPAIAPTPSMQPAANKVRFLRRRKLSKRPLICFRCKRKPRVTYRNFLNRSSSRIHQAITNS